MPEKLSPETDPLFSSDGEYSSMKRRNGFNEVSSRSYDNLIAAETASKNDESIGNLNSELSLSASESSNRSSESSNSPVKVVIPSEDSVSVNFLSHGSTSVIGRSRVMEDAVTVAPGREFSLFAVYNGDGGSRVSNGIGGGGQLQLHQLLATEIEEQRPPMVVPDDLSGGGEIDWKKVISGCFEKMDEEEEELSSMALVVVVVGKNELVVANCGDSRVVLCRAGVAMPLSLDHYKNKPNRPDERERLDAAGGLNMNQRGCCIQEVCSTSTSIGGKHLKPYVTSEPEVTVIKRTESDNFLIIASAGLWNVLSYFIACEVAKTCLDCQIRTDGTSTAKAAAMLARLAMAKGSKDNISVIVVELKKSDNGRSSSF